MSPRHDERRTDQLQAIEEFQSIADDLGIVVWLRGGWAVDFTIGSITRHHEDIDWFAPWESSPDLLHRLVEHGFASTGNAPPTQQADLVRGTVEHGIAWIRIKEDGKAVVAGGPWQGEAWPAGMLDGSVRELEGVRVRVISARAQITIKEMTPIWQPHLARRPKDRADIDRLRRHLAEHGA